MCVEGCVSILTINSSYFISTAPKAKDHWTRLRLYSIIICPMKPCANRQHNTPPAARAGAGSKMLRRERPRYRTNITFYSSAFRTGGGAGTIARCTCELANSDTAIRPTRSRVLYESRPNRPSLRAIDEICAAYESCAVHIPPPSLAGDLALRATRPSGPPVGRRTRPSVAPEGVR